MMASSSNNQSTPSPPPAPLLSHLVVTTDPDVCQLHPNEAVGQGLQGRCTADAAAQHSPSHAHLQPPSPDDTSSWPLPGYTSVLHIPSSLACRTAFTAFAAPCWLPTSNTCSQRRQRGPLPTSGGTPIKYHEKKPVSTRRRPHCGMLLVTLTSMVMVGLIWSDLQWPCQPGERCFVWMEGVRAAGLLAKGLG